jgi:S-DNA-T family DNA segregation ATPase FtsK/SpoIIIE
MAEQKKKPGRPKGSKNKKPSASTDKQSEIKKMQEERQADKKVIDEIWAVTIFAIGIFLIFTTQLNTTGEFGNAINNVLNGIFGGMSIVLPYYIMAFSTMLFFQKTNHVNARTVIFALLIYVMICIFNSQRFIDVNNLAFGLEEISKFYSDGIAHENAGVVGMFLGKILIKTIGAPGLNIFCVTGVLVSVLLVINTPISKQIERIKNKREEKNLLKAYEKNSNGIKDDISSERSKDEADTDIPIIKRSNNNGNIMKYMTDNEMFDRNKSTGEKGLENKKTPKDGFGIDEESETIVKKNTRRSNEEIPPEDIKIVKNEPQNGPRF